jgi:hypothetical protein
VQRVYEYTVEPAVLQNLPDHALLLAARDPGGRHLRAVECDPAISALTATRARFPLPVPAQRGPAELSPAAYRAATERRPGSYVPRYRA